MATIVNADFRDGDVVTATAVNAKFTDIVTATTTRLDATNFRDESIDALQFTSGVNATGARQIVLIATKMVDNGVGQTGGTDYTSKVHLSAADAVAHGGTNPRLVWNPGQALADTEILRVRWSLFLQNITTGLGAVFGNNGVSQCDMPVWLVYLQWDITSVALANWTEVPNQGDFTSNYTTAEGSVWTNCQATMTLPHVFLTYDGIQHIWSDLKNLTVQRGYNYINNTGSTITIYGIRAVIKGLYGPFNAVATGNLNAFARTYTDPGWSGEKVKIANVRMDALIMKTV